MRYILECFTVSGEHLPMRDIAGHSLTYIATIAQVLSSDNGCVYYIHDTETDRYSVYFAGQYQGSHAAFPSPVGD